MSVPNPLVSRTASAIVGGSGTSSTASGAAPVGRRSTEGAAPTTSPIEADLVRTRSFISDQVVMLAHASS